jgi:hypothetical protein
MATYPWIWRTWPDYIVGGQVEVSMKPQVQAPSLITDAKTNNSLSYGIFLLFFGVFLSLHLSFSFDLTDVRRKKFP